MLDFHFRLQTACVPGLELGLVFGRFVLWGLRVQIWPFSPGATGTSNFRASDVGQIHRWLGAMDRCFSWGFFLVLPPNWLKINENLRSGDFRWISIKLVLYGESISFYHLSTFSTAFLTIWWRCRYTFIVQANRKYSIWVQQIDALEKAIGSPGILAGPWNRAMWNWGFLKLFHNRKWFEATPIFWPAHLRIGRWLQIIFF